jgi:hypothetical protein
MDANLIPGTALHKLMTSVMPPHLPTVESTPAAKNPTDVVDLGPGSAGRSTPPSPTPSAPPVGFVPFAASAPTAAASAPAAPPATAGPAAAPQPRAVSNNPTVLTMDEPPAQLVDERRPPVEQARQVNGLVLKKLNEVANRRTMMTPQEVGNDLALLGWAADKLESLSHGLESAGQAKSKDNEFIEGLQRDLGSAIDSFRQIHAGAVLTTQNAAFYRTAVAQEQTQQMWQTSVMNSQRRAGVIGYYASTRNGINSGMGGMGMPMMPGGMPMGPGGMPMGPGGMPMGPNGMPLGPNGMPLGPNGMPMGMNGMPMGPGFVPNSGVNLGPMGGGYVPTSGVNLGPSGGYYGSPNAPVVLNVGGQPSWTPGTYPGNTWPR